MPSGVSERSPLIAYLIADGLVADDLRHQLERLLHLQREVVLRERELGRRQRRLLDRRDLVGVVQDRAVRVRADLEPRPVLALVHVRVHVADDREVDRRRFASSNRGTGPMSIIWCTAGVSGIDAPAIRASRGLQHAAADHDVLGLDVAAGRAHAPDAAVLDVDPEHLDVRRRRSARPTPARARA